MELITNTKALIKACEGLGIDYEITDKAGISVRVGDKFFINGRLPFNNTSLINIANNKWLTSEIFEKEIKMPKTIGYVDPDGEERYKPYIEKDNIDGIIEDIESNMSYPVVVKMNQGRTGINVYKCNSREEVIGSLRKIYDKQSKYYDYIAIVQEYLDIKREFRVIWFKEEIIFLYEKVVQGEKENISPLHNDGAKAVIVNGDIKEKIKDFLNQSETLKKFEYLGIDIALLADDTMELLEINGVPGFSYLVRDNGMESLVSIYTSILKRI